jgi:hypothetical protein
MKTPNEGFMKVLALITVLFAFGLEVLKSFHAETSVEWSRNIALIVLTFYFGTSVSSQRKTELMNAPAPLPPSGAEQRINQSSTTTVETVSPKTES